MTIKTNSILKIEDLCANINDTIIIDNLNLSINAGEIHAIMGQNGSGKSTLAKIIAGHPKYEITKGNIFFKGQKITYTDPEHRANEGIFLAFQYPVEIPGVSNADFLRTAYNSKKKANKSKELDPLTFFELISNKLKQINMGKEFLSRNVNEGFSGGEKKKNEILQMSLFNNKLSILDEIDSGLDVDALKSIAYQINNLHNKYNAILLITHYQRLLDHITPDYIHVMNKGKIIYTGDASIAEQIEKYGYDFFKK